MRALIKSAVFGGAIFVRRRLDGGRATVLNYHRFPEENTAGFRWQCEYLKRSCYVIGMSELAARLRDGGALPAHATVITVDDGHRDFYACAYPILREFGFPAVMYLPTAFLDGEWLWFDRFQYIFRHSPLESAQCAGLAPLSDITIDLTSRAARDKAFMRIAHQAQWLPAAERDRLGDRLADQLRVPVPERPTEEFAPLSWDEVREMAHHGIEFGGHTVAHPILQTLHSAESLASEIAGCKARIEEELQTAAPHFAYPSGRENEVTPLALEAVRNAAFETGVSTVSGQVAGGDDLLWLRRIGADPRGRPSLVSPLRRRGEGRLMPPSALEFTAASETDIPAIRRLLIDVFATPEDWRTFQPEVLRWKGFEPHPLWEGPRSYVVRAGERIVAHGCVVPCEIAARAGVVRGARIIDWAADRATAGAGARIFNGILQRRDVVFAVGGSADTQRILPLMGYRKTQECMHYARVIRPLRRMAAEADRSWRAPVRAIRDLVRLSKPAHSTRPGWEYRRVDRFDAAEWPQIAARPDFAESRRTPELLNYLLRCPAAQTEGYLLFREGRMAGFAVLCRVGSECRLADVRIAAASSNDWADAYALAAEAAANSAATATLTARVFSPFRRQALNGCGFLPQGSESLFRKDRTQGSAAEDELELGILDDDYFYL